MTEKAVLYARVSGDDRQNSTSSLQGQLEICRDFAEKMGYEVVAELSEDDRGASGAVWDLPEISHALDMARASKFSVLITRELDRFARKLAKQLVVEEEFKRLGVRVEYVLENYKDTPEGQLQKQIRAVIAEYEREKINERMVRGRRRKVKSGYVVLHGNRPYGYTTVKDEYGIKLVIDKETGAIVKMIFEWYVFKEWGQPKIAKELNRLGIPPPSAHMKTKTTRAVKWNQGQIGRIIRNETYAGVWHYGKRNRQGKNPKDYHITVEVPAIVSREIFDRAQKQRKRNTIGTRHGKKWEYLLSRRVTCGECQSSMVSLTKSYPHVDYSYYRCSVHFLQGTHYLYTQCNMRTHFRTDYWDRVVWEEIKGFLLNPEKIIKGINHYKREMEEVNKPIKERLKIIDDLLDGKKKELERLLDLYLIGEFERDALFDRKQRLESTILALQEERKSLDLQTRLSLTTKELAELQAFSEHLAKGLDKADQNFAARQRIINFLDAQVTLSVEDGRQIALLKCEFGFQRRLVMNDDKTTYTSFPLPESELSTNSHEGEEDSYMSSHTHSTDCSSN